MMVNGVKVGFIDNIFSDYFSLFFLSFEMKSIWEILLVFTIFSFSLSNKIQSKAIVKIGLSQ